MNIIIGGIHIDRAAVHDQGNAHNDGAVPQPPFLLFLRLLPPFVPESVQADQCSQHNAHLVNQDIENAPVEQLQRPHGNKCQPGYQHDNRRQRILQHAQHSGNRRVLFLPPAAPCKNSMHACHRKRSGKCIHNAPEQRRELGFRHAIDHAGLDRHIVNAAVMIEAQLIVGSLSGVQRLCLRLGADREPASLHAADGIDIGVSRRHIRIHGNRGIRRNLLRECNLLLCRQRHGAALFHMEQLELCHSLRLYGFHVEFQRLQMRMLCNKIFTGILLFTDRLRDT